MCVSFGKLFELLRSIGFYPQIMGVFRCWGISVLQSKPGTLKPSLNLRSTPSVLHEQPGSCLKSWEKIIKLLGGLGCLPQLTNWAHTEGFLEEAASSALKLIEIMPWFDETLEGICELETMDAEIARAPALQDRFGAPYHHYQRPQNNC